MEGGKTKKRVGATKWDFHRSHLGPGLCPKGHGRPQSVTLPHSPTQCYRPKLFNSPQVLSPVVSTGPGCPLYLESLSSLLYSVNSDVSHETHFKNCLLQEDFPDPRSPPCPGLVLDAASLCHPSTLSYIMYLPSTRGYLLGGPAQHFIKHGAHNQKSVVASTLDSELPETKAAHPLFPRVLFST